MAITFSGPEFSKSGGKLAPSAHVVALVEENGTREKWRACLTMNDDGTWQWAPGFPAHIAVPDNVMATISSAVSEQVKKNGVTRIEV